MSRTAGGRGVGIRSRWSNARSTHSPGCCGGGLGGRGVRRGRREGVAWESVPDGRMRARSNPQSVAGEALMSRILSVPEIIASLEKQVAAHREQEARHAEREAFHREQRETHASELEALTRRLDEFRAAAAAAMDLALRDPAPAPGPPVGEED